MEIFGYLAFVGMGIFLGSMGAGGSLLTIPVLVYIFSLDMVMASAYSTFLVGVTSLAGVVRKQRKQLIDLPAALGFGIPSVLTTFAVRKWLIVAIPDVVFQTASFQLTKDTVLLIFFSLLMLVSSTLMILKRNSGNDAEGEYMIIPLMGAGSLTGFLAGLVGVGGGFLIVPALVFFARLPFSRAVGTALVIIASNSLLGFCGDLMNHSFNWFFLLPLTGLALIGLYIGGHADRLLTAGASRQRSFGWIILAVGMFMLLHEVSFL